jgi:hypothetical protein
VQFVADNPDVARIFRNDVQQIKEIPRLAHVERNRQESCQIWNGVVRAGIDRGVFQAQLTPRSSCGPCSTACWPASVGSRPSAARPPADQRAALPAVRRRFEVTPTSFPNVHVRWRPPSARSADVNAGVVRGRVRGRRGVTGRRLGGRAYGREVTAALAADTTEPSRRSGRTRARRCSSCWWWAPRWRARSSPDRSTPRSSRAGPRSSSRSASRPCPSSYSAWS